jgi:hypothetical protein
MKLLVDECLSPELTKLAQSRGHLDASHITWIGKSGWKDWELKQVILDGDWVFVTKNSVDFRGPAASPGTTGQYAHFTLHAGLICINGPVGMDLDLQLELFGLALDELDRSSDMINEVLEVTLSEVDDDVEILRYRLPSD